MKIRKFTVRLRNSDGAERDVEVLASDEDSAKHAAEYLNNEDARTGEKVVDVRLRGDRG